MKNKASLVLLEQLIMTLVFALAAAICLQIFVKADSVSLETARLGQAQVLAQNAAETVKSTHGDLIRAAAVLGGSADDHVLVLESEELLLTVSKLPAEKGLGKADVTVTFEDATLLAFTAGWQEVAS